MKTSILFGVWVYMLAAVAAEVWVFYLNLSSSIEASTISILAASQAVAIVLFFMHLRDEPGSVRLFALIPIMFLSALLIAMLATLG